VAFTAAQVERLREALQYVEASDAAGAALKLAALLDPKS
jgi:hypothetical protein